MKMEPAVRSGSVFDSTTVLVKCLGGFMHSKVLLKQEVPVTLLKIWDRLLAFSRLTGGLIRLK